MKNYYDLKMTNIANIQVIKGKVYIAAAQVLLLLTVIK